MTSLLQRIFKTQPRAEHLTFIVYTRADCCCCHKAIELLGEYQKRWRYGITQVDVDADPELAARHGWEVPVVELDGKVRFRGLVNPALLERLLLAESRRSKDDQK
jgi:hypothetical protein